MGEHFAYIKNERHSESSPLNLFTDACAAGSKGYGAIFGKHWFYCAWPDSWKSLFLELFLIVIALHVLGLLWLTYG